jgi:hypothetical protein
MNVNGAEHFEGQSAMSNKIATGAPTARREAASPGFLKRDSHWPREETESFRIGARRTITPAA